MEDKNLEILKEINNNLKEINSRLATKELFSESEKLLDRVDLRVEYSTNQIQNTFDRIHDKVFNFNNILIATYLVLGTFPSESPILKLWTVIFPVFNLIFLIFLDIRQMEIHRFSTKAKEWTSTDREKYGRKINGQTLLSLFSFAISFSCLIYLILKII